MKYVCILCDEKFGSKKSLISHLEDEIDMAQEEAMNAE